MKTITEKDLRSRLFYQVIVAIELLLIAIIAPIALNLLKSLTLISVLPETKTNFVVGICMFAFVAILDILVAWGLMKVFINDQRFISISTMIFRVVYTILLILGLLAIMKLEKGFSLAEYKIAFNVFETI